MTLRLAMVYNAAKSVEMANKKIISIYPQSYTLDEYEIKFAKNPKSTSIEIDYIGYEIYVEGDFSAKGKNPCFY